MKLDGFPVGRAQTKSRKRCSIGVFEKSATDYIFANSDACSLAMRPMRRRAAFLLSDHTVHRTISCPRGGQRKTGGFDLHRNTRNGRGRCVDTTAKKAQTSSACFISNASSALRVASLSRLRTLGNKKLGTTFLNTENQKLKLTTYWSKTTLCASSCCAFFWLGLPERSFTIPTRCESAFVFVFFCHPLDEDRSHLRKPTELRNYGITVGEQVVRCLRLTESHSTK